MDVKNKTLKEIRISTIMFFKDVTLQRLKMFPSIMLLTDEYQI